MLWTLKYKPNKIEEVAGNEEILEEVKKWALDWNRNIEGKPLLLHGSPGIGKSALAYAIAQSMEWDIIEMNASNLRTKDMIERIAGAASVTMGLFGKRKLILLDEIDGLQSRDRGGAPAVLDLIKNARQPIILIANDIWQQNLAYIRAMCKQIEMKKLNSRTMSSILTRLIKNEHLNVNESIIQEIAKNSEGDLRSAINDLQAVCEGKTEVTTLASLSYRDRIKNVFDSVRKVFKAKTFDDARSSLYGLDLDHNMFLQWIDQNIPNEYEKISDIAKAYDNLSRADVFDGRITNRQYWGFLRYSNDLMTAGIALAKEEPYHKFTKYQFPSYIKALSQTRARRAMEKSVGLKIGSRCHVSRRDALLYLPLIRLLATDQENKLKSFFNFEDEEMEFILGKKKAETPKKKTKL
ncbi:replication factor C large subunit [Candidatus Micrarchaeota archaeon]|nr:replication factor C large subunit [Candidatus Micrarchaeota archaeon]